MYLYIQSVPAAAAADLCVAIYCGWAPVAGVRRRVPDGKIIAASLNLIPSLDLFLLILKNLFLFNVPPGSVVASTASICV